MDQKLHLSIETWLDKLDLLIYISFFKDYNGVEDILWMTERELKDIGIKNGSHRARLGSSIAILKEKYEKTERFLTPERNATPSNGSHSNFSVSPIKSVQLAEGVRSWPTTKSSTAHSTKHTSPRYSIDGSVVTEATAEDLKKALEKELSLDSSDLRSHAWYHGTILRQRAEELVAKDGDFLVRDCISQPGDFVITCKWKELPLHFIVKKIILQPDTVYERTQYFFEKHSFDSIRDFVTFYVGSQCPLSESSGVVIQRPVNRSMPLSYYESRYGIQCQIHYVAKALEKLPVVNEGNKENSCPDVRGTVGPKEQLTSSKLVRMGSDPSISPSTERRSYERRPNSGLFNSDPVSSKVEEDRPPPKPSRIPSRKFVRRPVIIRKHRKPSEHEDLSPVPSTDAVPTSCSDTEQSVPISGVDVDQPVPIRGQNPADIFKRQLSETRFSFLDRPSASSGNSTPVGLPIDHNHTPNQFTLPKMSNVSEFEPHTFLTPFLACGNLPLEGPVLARVRHLLLSVSTKTLASHLTRADLQAVKQFEHVDLGLGVTSGLELLLLPQGEQMQKDLLERTQSMKLFVAVVILTTPDEEERVHILNRWIEIAIETKTVLGNLFGFTAIMLGLTLPEISGLHSVWLSLRHLHTETAFAFETKLRPALNQLHACTAPPPNACLPYCLSLLLVLRHYADAMSAGLPEDKMEIELPGKSADYYGLQLLADHLQSGRYLMQDVPIFKENGDRSLQSQVFDDLVLDLFSTEFHLRLLWGYRGSVVCAEQRHTVFEKVVHSLYNKCTMVVQ